MARHGLSSAHDLQEAIKKQSDVDRDAPILVDLAQARHELQALQVAHHTFFLLLLLRLPLVSS